jgi:hypothetical protein
VSVNGWYCALVYGMRMSSKQAGLCCGIVEEIGGKFGVSWLKAHRLARAVEEVLKTYDLDGLQRPNLTVQRLCEWEHDPNKRPGEDYLDRFVPRVSDQG